MTEITTAYVKGLFHHLVKEVGGQDAAAAFLGISQQRVSQLQLKTNNDLPTLMQIATLEKVCGRSIVFAALANAIQPNALAEPLKEAGDVMVKAAEAFDAQRSGADPKIKLRVALQVRAEADELVAAAAREAGEA